MRSISRILVVSATVLGAAGVLNAQTLDVDVNTDDGVNANVGAADTAEANVSIGGGSGTEADASVGDSVAEADVDVGGGDGAEADVDIGNDVAGADADIGGGDGTNADIDLLGGTATADINGSAGSGVGTDVEIGGSEGGGTAVAGTDPAAGTGTSGASAATGTAEFVATSPAGTGNGSASGPGQPINPAILVGLPVLSSDMKHIGVVEGVRTTDTNRTVLEVSLFPALGLPVDHALISLTERAFQETQIVLGETRDTFVDNIASLL
ncbi:hypothetical protein [Pseudoruegeria sp. HB172150]|uniref:hypothetical protein n=1 Tax=Pseudoruegeria sp. HB172150 TaxID=2721164 RepID=UPI001551CF61|nr:hypothetical protein [Pseudoruegeria sp. HB172150]